jgi:hypothetical protein
MKAKVLLFAMLLIFVACGKKTNVKGVVACKYVEPQHIVLQPIPCGKGCMIMPYTYPQQHIIVVEVDWLDSQFERNVGYDLYNKVSVGDSVIIEVRIK